MCPEPQFRRVSRVVRLEDGSRVAASYQTLAPVGQANRGPKIPVQLTSNQTSLLPDKLAGDATFTSVPATTGPRSSLHVCVPMKSPRVCPLAKQVCCCNQSQTRFIVRNAANSRGTNTRYELPPASLSGRSTSLVASDLQLQPTSPNHGDTQTYSQEAAPCQLVWQEHEFGS